jgi:hypothetical protein
VQWGEELTRRFDCRIRLVHLAHMIRNLRPCRGSIGWSANAPDAIEFTASSINPAIQ